MEIYIPIKKQHVNRAFLRGIGAVILGVFLYFFYTDIAQLIFPESALKYNIVWYIIIALYIGSFLLMVAGSATLIITFVSREKWKKLLVITDQGIVTDYGPPIKDSIKGVLIPWADLESFTIKPIRKRAGMVVHLKDNEAFLEKITDSRIRTILDKRMRDTGGYINLPTYLYDFDMNELVRIFKSKGLTEGF